jgi:ribonuclease BN (tRNA processing enzyme)
MYPISTTIAGLACALVLITAPFDASAQSCPVSPVALQILGSGGPRLSNDRASTSYLLWVGGKARMLVDMGGGSYLRLGQSQARLDDLALVAISHLHPDHVSDLPALLWVSHQVRKAPLPLVGPSAGKGVAGPQGNDLAPDIATFLTRMFDEKVGAFQVMGATLGATTGNGVRLNVSGIDVLKSAPSAVFDADGLKVTAIGIPHGNMPTLAYRVETDQGSIVFSSDQNGSDPAFVEFAKGADILIMHLMTPVGMKNPLHAEPAVVGRIAQEVRPGRLIVSHIGLTGAALDAAIADLKRFYSGPLIVGADMQCTPLAR